MQIGKLELLLNVFSKQLALYIYSLMVQFCLEEIYALLSYLIFILIVVYNKKLPIKNKQPQQKSVRVLRANIFHLSSVVWQDLNEWVYNK